MPMKKHKPESCFTNPPIIGAHGIGRGFGNSGTGIVDGPGNRISIWQFQKR